MASSLDSKWAAHLKLLESDVKRIRNGSKLRQPLGFLMFLNNVSRQEDAFALTSVQLQELKRQTLSEEPLPIRENDKNSETDLSQETTCPLGLGCNEVGSSNLPRQFESNEDFEDKLPAAVNLGQGESTDSIEEGRNKLWFREFPPDQQNMSQSRFIPEEFLENIPDIPKEFKDSFRTVKHVVSACEKVSKLIAKEEKDCDPTDLLLKKMKWAQSLLDVWQLEHHDQINVQESLWREEDWLDTLTAPLFKDRDEPNSLWDKLQSHLREASSLDIPSFLKDLNSNVSINGQHSKAQNSKRIAKRSKILTSFFNSSTLFLATFFTGKVLGLAGPQSEPMVQKHGTLLGNLFEKNVFQALKDTISKRSRWITIFCGLVVSGGEQGKNEFDFLIILGQVKKIIYVECKYTLRKEIAQKIKKQSNNAFEYLQMHLPVTKGWEFLTWACFEETASIPICSKCRPYLVEISNLDASLSKILNERKNDDIENGSTKADYEDLVKTHLFHASANKQVFEGSQVAKHQLKMVDFPSQSIILWNLHQLTILQKDPYRMIIRGFGRFGTGKTEILKAKAIKLAEDENTLVAFLVARPFVARRKSERLVTKFLRFQLKPYKNIKVAEIQNDDFSTKGSFDAFFMDMVPETENVRNLKIHVFIDEASRSNVALVEDVLVNLPNDPDRFIWIVDTEEKCSSDSLSHSFRHEFEIEEGLVLNLRNSQEIQAKIPLIQENQDNKKEGIDSVEVEKLISVLKMERNAQQILVILPHADNYVVAFQEMNKEIKSIKTYGLDRKGVENCTDADLEDFFNAPKLKDQQILVTLEGHVNGFEAEMVLFTEFHDFGSKYVLYRAKTKLQTTTLKKYAHPTLHEQYPVEDHEVKNPAPNLRASDFTSLRVECYSKLQPKPDPGSSYVNYCDFESSGSPEQLSQVSSIKQFNIVVPKTSTKKVNDFPLLLWLKLSNEWKTNICINLKGLPLPSDHSMNFPIHWDNLEIVNISIPHLQGCHNWKNVLMAEIIHCHHCKLDVPRGFDFHRLFSVWSRIREEFKLQKYIFDKKQLDDESYDEFRMEILKECLFVANTVHLAKYILKSYGIDAQSQQPNQIDHFLKWLCPELNSPVDDFLISWEIPEYPFENTAKNNSERPAITHLRHELIYLFDDVQPSSRELHRPLTSLIWEEKLCRLFREILIKDFAHVVEESWFSEFVSMESVCQRKKETILETRGNRSIYTQFQDQNVSTNDCIPPESRSIFAKILMFIANQSI